MIFFSKVSRNVSPNTELQELLLSWNKEADISSVDSTGRTTIHTLAGEGNSTLLSLVLSTHPEVNLEAEDRHGQTALNLAARHGYLEVVQVIFYNYWTCRLHLNRDIDFAMGKFSGSSYCGIGL